MPTLQFKSNPDTHVQLKYTHLQLNIITIFSPQI